MALVRVLHDFSPNNVERSRAVQKGQTYELIQKTNPDWWLVRDRATTDRFFVPSSYVEELSQTFNEIPSNASGKKKTPPEPAIRRDKIDESLKMLDDAIFGEADGDEEPAEIQYATVANKLSSVIVASAANKDNRAAMDNKPLTSKDNSCMPDNAKKIITLPRTSPSEAKPVTRTYSKKEGQQPPTGDISVNTKPLKRDDSSKAKKPPLPSPKNERASNGNSDNSEGLYVNYSGKKTAEVEEVEEVEDKVDEAQPVYANLNELQETIFKHLPEPKPVSRPADVLPPGWDISIDQSGRPFYMHKITGKTSWTLPTDNKSNQSRRTICVNGDFANALESMLGVANRVPWSPSRIVKSGSVSDDADISSPKLSSKDAISAEKPQPQEVPSIVPTAHPTPPPQLPAGYVASTLTRIPSHSSSSRLADRTSKMPAGPVLVNSPASETAKRATLVVEAPGSKSASPQLQERAQNLNRTKIMENGKKCKKNWAVVFVGTDGRYLYFYSKAGAPKPSQCPEAIVDLLNAEIKTGAEVEQLSSKKHVISVKTENNSEYLLNTDVPDDLMLWAAVLINNVKAMKAMPTESLPGAGVRTMTLKKHPSFKSNVDEDTPQKKREALNAFLPRRKTIKDLKDKNIYKFAPVFGNHLQLLCDREKSLVPKFVTKCISAVEKKGLNATGLYRISGNLADIQSLRFMINKDEKYEKYDDLATKFDIHVLTGALKLFFRELQEPLFTFALFDSFLKTMEEKDEKVRCKQEKEIIDRLPLANKETTKVLFKHIANVVAQRSENQMSSHSIAVVFGPTLLWPESVSSLELGTLLVCQGRVVENLLTDIASLF